jgi:hypothetical protein
LAREPSWSTALVVGKESYVEAIRKALGIRGLHREIVSDAETYMLQDANAE